MDPRVLLAVVKRGVAGPYRWCSESHTIRVAWISAYCCPMNNRGENETFAQLGSRLLFSLLVGCYPG